MIIRECLASDAVAVDLLFQEFVAYLRSIGDESHYSFGAQQYLADGLGADTTFRVFMAYDASSLIRYVLYSRTYDGDYVRNLNIIDLYVQEASRGNGVGRMLMGAVEKRAQAEGITRLSWAVHKNNAAAIRFYETLGAQYSSHSHVMRLDLVQRPR
jgi:ribosomal protein S18 acetylase RimI-like enzyme